MASMTSNVENISDVQQQILAFIKQQGETTNAAIAEDLNVSYEAVRQQLRQLEAAQLVVSAKKRPEGQRVGRPTRVYTLSKAGDHLFPKAYDELAVELIDTLAAALGPGALRQVLASLADENVRQWAPHVQDKSLPERLEALKGIYLEDDPYMAVDQDQASGELRLVERNCPYLNVAFRRPALCSVTISTLSRLLGYVVTREKRFQDGDGRCVFRVHLDRPINADAFRFAFESEMNHSS
ncbi:MAG: winged helix-turn-helix transcriptional regulator [Anaerolineae bacterium]|nr:winged helix-turn-helix transcriptional regulator [Anaerolineae bacterium]